jgi:succinyl-diaminopimelate desuccinylase
MKGSIAALLWAIHAVQSCQQRPRFNIEVAFVPDEETNSLLGTGYVVDQGLFDADYAVVCEGGREDVIGCGHSGVLWMEVTVQGKSGHAARPHLGVNAFEKAVALCHELEAYKAEQKKHVFTAPGGETFTPPLTLGGETRSGPASKINTIPHQFSFTLDRRVLPDEDMDRVERDLRAFLQACTGKIHGLAIEVRKISSRPSSLVSETSPLPQAFRQAAQRHRPQANFGITSGFTDMAFYANQAHLPTIGYGVAGRHTHGIDEAVSLEDLLTTTRIYAEFMTTWDPT